jgi:hypothetical protein
VGHLRGTGQLVQRGWASLWLQARELLSQQGYSTFSLWVFAENEPAIGFDADTLPPEKFELGGRQLQELRYVCRTDN